MKGHFMNYVKLVVIWALILLSITFIASCDNRQINKPQEDKKIIKNIKFEDIKFENIVKIAIIPQISDKTKKAYALKEEVTVTDKVTISEFSALAAKGKFELVLADRLPSEYILYLYFEDGKKMRADYWIQSSQYNLTIEGLTGSITVAYREMDEIIMKAVGEVGRRPNEYPFKK